METIELVVIVGPTASGKSESALDIARKHNGEIICADSRTVYKYLDIGTAKPSLSEREEIPHHILDVVEPSEAFSVARFQGLAYKAIEEIKSRGKLPIIVGGSGLYVDSVIFEYIFPDKPNTLLRQKLVTKSVQQLQQIIIDKNLKLPNNYKNHRHLSRVIETGGKSGSKSELRNNTIVVGVNPGLEVIKQRITQRVDLMIKQGLIQEVLGLAERFSWDSPGLQSTGYKAFSDYGNGLCTVEEARSQFIKNDYKLARRQLTWFRRNKSIQWVEKQSEVVDLVTTALNKRQ